MGIQLFLFRQRLKVRLDGQGHHCGRRVREIVGYVHGDCVILRNALIGCSPAASGWSYRSEGGKGLAHSGSFGKLGAHHGNFLYQSITS